MKEIIKKYWFVGLIGIVLIGGIIYFAYDTNKDVVQGKTKDGENVVYTLKEEDITASSFYDSLYKTMGTSSIAQRFQFIVVDQTIETTDEMKETAKTQADQLIQQYKSSYGAEYEDLLLMALKSIGYNKISDLETHLTISLKYNQMITESTKELFDAFKTEFKPRLISHILVKMEDTENPTAEENKKLEDVKAALALGDKTFDEIANTMSDDTASAVNNGSIGYTDKNSNLVPEFLAASLLLEEGALSEWVKTDYGYHLIRCDATNYEALEKFDDFINAVHGANPEFIPNKLFDYAKDLGVEFSTPELETELRALYGLGGQN